MSQRMTITVSEALYTGIYKLAFDNNCSMGEIIRHALYKELSKYEDGVRLNGKLHTKVQDD